MRYRNNRKAAFRETALLKQYGLAIDIFNQEAGRFWMRFNIFMGIQVAGVIGILSNLNVLVSNEGIFRCVLAFCGVLSTLFVLICIRGVMTACVLVKLIKHVESKSSGQLFLVGKLEKLDSKRPQYVNCIIATIMVVLFSGVWWGSLVWLEKTNYAIEPPSKTKCCAQLGTGADTSNCAPLPKSGGLSNCSGTERLFHAVYGRGKLTMPAMI